MTPEAQRIAIAEACGWRFGSSEDDPTECWHRPTAGGIINSLIIPDFLNDLNAMHEAEKILNHFQMRKYGENLQLAVNALSVGWTSSYEEQLKGLSYIAHATAAQRAESFLRAIDKWTDS